MYLSSRVVVEDHGDAVPIYIIIIIIIIIITITIIICIIIIVISSSSSSSSSSGSMIAVPPEAEDDLVQDLQAGLPSQPGVQLVVDKARRGAAPQHLVRERKPHDLIA